MPKEGITPCVQLEAVRGCGGQMQGTLFKWTNYISGMLRRRVLWTRATVMLAITDCVQDGSRGGLCWIQASSLTTSPRKR